MAGLTFSSGQTICHYYCRYYYIFRRLLFLTGETLSVSRGPFRGRIKNMIFYRNKLLELLSYSNSEVVVKHIHVHKQSHVIRQPDQINRQLLGITRWQLVCYIQKGVQMTEEIVRLIIYCNFIIIFRAPALNFVYNSIYRVQAKENAGRFFHIPSHHEPSSITSLNSVKSNLSKFSTLER